MTLAPQDESGFSGSMVRVARAVRNVNGARDENTRRNALNNLMDAVRTFLTMSSIAPNNKEAKELKAALAKRRSNRHLQCA